jgi:hypothetical protein
MLSKCKILCYSSLLAGAIIANDARADEVVYYIGPDNLSHVPVSAGAPLPVTGGSGGGKATVANPLYTEGSTSNPLSLDLNGNLRVVSSGGATATKQDAQTSDLDAIKAAVQGTGPTTTGNLGATLAMTTATTTKIITGVSGKSTYIDGMSISSSAAATVSLVSSTTQGNNCATSPTTIWQMDFVAGGGVAYGAGVANLMGAVAALSDVCVTVSATSNVKTNLTYAQQ